MLHFACRMIVNLTKGYTLDLQNLSEDLDENATPLNWLIQGED